MSDEVETLLDAVSLEVAFDEVSDGVLDEVSEASDEALDVSEETLDDSDEFSDGVDSVDEAPDEALDEASDVTLEPVSDGMESVEASDDVDATDEDSAVDGVLPVCSVAPTENGSIVNTKRQITIKNDTVILFIFIPQKLFYSQFVCRSTAIDLGLLNNG